MKKLIYIFSICLGLLATSCNDWLDLLPNNEQVTDNYWKSKEDGENCAVVLYIRWRQNQVLQKTNRLVNYKISICNLRVACVIIGRCIRLSVWPTLCCIMPMVFVDWMTPILKVQ
mgnify:CR=1 FL=1